MSMTVLRKSRTVLGLVTRFKRWNPVEAQAIIMGVVSIDDVWARIIMHEGEVFTLVGGKEFTYTVNGSVLRPTGVNRNLPKSTFEKALLIMPVSGPGALNKVVQGPAYVYAILTDERMGWE
jgi:hypothetical protein